MSFSYENFFQLTLFPGITSPNYTCIYILVAPSTKQDKQKKKMQTHIISFDNEDEEEETSKETTSSISAPPTSLDSPITFTNNSASLALNLPKSFGESNDTCGSAEDKSPDWQSWYGFHVV